VREPDKAVHLVQQRVEAEGAVVAGDGAGGVQQEGLYVVKCVAGEGGVLEHGVEGVPGVSGGLGRVGGWRCLGAESGFCKWAAWGSESSAKSSCRDKKPTSKNPPTGTNKTHHSQPPQEMCSSVCRAGGWRPGAAAAAIAAGSSSQPPPSTSSACRPPGGLPVAAAIHSACSSASTGGSDSSAVTGPTYARMCTARAESAAAALTLSCSTICCFKTAGSSGPGVNTVALQPRRRSSASVAKSAASGLPAIVTSEQEPALSASSKNSPQASRRPGVVGGGGAVVVEFEGGRGGESKIGSRQEYSWKVAGFDRNLEASLKAWCWCVGR